MCVCVCVGGWAEGGVAYFENRDQTINDGMIRHARCEDTRAECQTYGLKLKLGRLLMVVVEGGRGEGACPPMKIFKSESLKAPFPIADSCVDKVPKIDRYFLLNFDKRAFHQL